MASTESQSGTGEPVSLPPMFDLGFVADPYAALAQAREATPVYHDELTGRYILTRAADVHEALHDRSYSRDPRNATASPFMRRVADREEEEQGTSILFMDPPDHTRLRGLVNKAFTPRAVEAMRPRAQEIADQLLDAASADGRGFDIIGDFAAPMPTVVIAEMLGVGYGDRDRFKTLSDQLVQGLNPFLNDEARAKLDAARAELADFFQAEIADRRRSPRGDLISGLIEAEEQGDQLTEEEMIGTCILLLVAGNVTTTDLIGNGSLALLKHPEQFAMLREDPSLIPNAVEEVLRYDPPVLMTGRIVMDEREVAGCPVHKGESLTPSLAAANHDPRAYPDPDKFDITRADTKHHSFGGGAHYCLGAPLARMEGQVALGTLARRFPKLRLEHEGQLDYRTLPGFRGLLRLPVLFD